MSPSRTGPFTFRMIARVGSFRNSTFTCVHCPWEPVRPRTLITRAKTTGLSIFQNFCDRNDVLAAKIQLKRERQRRKIDFADVRVSIRSVSNEGHFIRRVRLPFCPRLHCKSCARTVRSCLKVPQVVNSPKPVFLKERNIPKP